MTQSPMTRRTLFALGAPAALVAFVACSKSSSGTSNSTTSKSVSTPDNVVSFNWPECTGCGANLRAKNAPNYQGL